MQKYTVVVDDEGTIRWHKEGTEILHREDGPAVEWFDGNKLWYQNGKLHRLNGPAVECAGGRKRWYIEGVEYSEEAYWDKILLIATQEHLNLID